MKRPEGWRGDRVVRALITPVSQLSRTVRVSGADRLGSIGRMHLDELATRIDGISARYAQIHGVDRSPDWALLKLTEEVGELVQAHLTATGQSKDRGLGAEEQRRKVAAELGDVIGMCLVFASQAGIDAEAAVAETWLPHERPQDPADR